MTVELMSASVSLGAMAMAGPAGETVRGDKKKRGRLKLLEHEPSELYLPQAAYSFKVNL